MDTTSEQQTQTTAADPVMSWVSNGVGKSELFVGAKAVARVYLPVNASHWSWIAYGRDTGFEPSEILAKKKARAAAGR